MKGMVCYMSEGKLIIDIVMPESNNVSIVNDIKKLPKLKQIEEPPTLLISDLNKKSKERKKEKKKAKKVESEPAEFILYDDGSDKNTDIYADLISAEDILDNRGIYEDEDDELTSLDDDTKDRKKRKKPKDNFEKVFASELGSLYSLFAEIDKFGKDLEKELNGIKGQRSRGVSKYTNDLGELVLSSKEKKLHTLKEITNLKKTIADLNMKHQAKNKDGDTPNSPERLASAYFKQLLSGGNRNLVMGSMTGNYSGEDEEYPVYDTSNDDNLTDKLFKRLEDGERTRSVDADKYLEYEGKGVKICVRKCIDSGEWEFSAIDKDNQLIDDYPLPTKKSAGRMKFSDDGTYCTDILSRMYKVIEYYSPDVNDYDDDEE